MSSSSSSSSTLPLNSILASVPLCSSKSSASLSSSVPALLSESCGVKRRVQTDKADSVWVCVWFLLLTSAGALCGTVRKLRRCILQEEAVFNHRNVKNKITEEKTREQKQVHLRHMCVYSSSIVDTEDAPPEKKVRKEKMRYS